MKNRIKLTSSEKQMLSDFYSKMLEQCKSKDEVFELFGLLFKIADGSGTTDGLLESVIAKLTEI